MSKTIECEVDVDIDIMERVAQNLGWNVQRNVAVRGYYGNISERADLVIKSRSYAIGFIQDNYGKVTAVYDDMATRDLNTIMPEYKIEYCASKLTNSGLSTSRADSKEELIIWAKRK